VSVSFPLGFRAGGVTAGFKPSGDPDLALLVGVPGTTAAGLFTTNRVVAAPVGLSRARLAAGHGTAVLVNSGQANAATGARGAADAVRSVEAAAGLLDVEPDDVLACSTGVIGEPVHMDVLIPALPDLVGALSSDGGDAFARAIMTTDTVSKQASAERGAYRVGGAAKGVGMISPNLATMLAFVTTDAPMGRRDLQDLANDILRPRFNGFTVDASTSTNDTVLLFASGAAGGAPVAPGSSGWDDLAGAIDEVGASLVSQLIHDAEGVTHVLLIDVDGARDAAEARTIARAVADSPLVKTAVFGEDPNPGRVLQAVGASGADLDATRIDVWFGDVQLAAAGAIPPAYFEEPALRAAAKATMAAREVPIGVRVGDGPGRARILGCDLSYDYVRINGEYTT
jgi:glutamate N-acetyltransferase/amino-acid N-acetyltransferase